MSTALIPVSQIRSVVEQDHSMLPAMTILEAKQRFNAMVEFTKDIMKPGKDFGSVPGTEKPTLLKPGAEKLSTFFGLVPKFETVEKVQDWTGNQHGEPFFYYMVKCRLYRGDRFMGEGDGSCNSWESRYRYRWVGEHDVPPDIDKSRCRKRGGKVSEFCFSVDKAETGGKYGKPAEYWKRFKDAIANNTASKVKKITKDGREFGAWEIDQTLFRIPNSDIADAVNTVLKIACKRALVAAVLITTNASEYYTQDLDDLEVIDVEFSESQHQPQKAASAQQQSQQQAAQSSANGNGQSSQKKVKTPAEFAAAMHNLADDWEKKGLCTAQLMLDKHQAWGKAQGVDKPFSEWPENLRGTVGKFTLDLKGFFAQPAQEEFLQAMNDLIGQLGWAAEPAREKLAEAGIVLQRGELPNDYRAQQAISYLQKVIQDREASKPEQQQEAEPSLPGGDQYETIPF